jgi:hypothetical protein
MQSKFKSCPTIIADTLSIALPETYSQQTDNQPTIDRKSSCGQSLETEPSAREYSIAVMRYFMAILTSSHLAAGKLTGPGSRTFGRRYLGVQTSSECSVGQCSYWERSYDLIRNTQTLPALFVVNHADRRPQRGWNNILPASHEHERGSNSVSAVHTLPKSICKIDLPLSRLGLWGSNKILQEGQFCTADESLGSGLDFEMTPKISLLHPCRWIGIDRDRSVEINMEAEVQG